MSETHDGFISIKHLAVQLGMDRSHARRYILRLGIVPQKRRTSDSGGQLTLTVTNEEAEAILKHRRAQGFSSEKVSIDTETGVFYVIQLVPELDPKRVKLGFTTDAHTRLAQHRTAAPTAIALKTWPCKRSWENTVIDCLTHQICRHILNEVFECGEIDELLARGDRLFELLPSPNSKIELSEESPYQG